MLSADSLSSASSAQSAQSAVKKVFGLFQGSENSAADENVKGLNAEC
jgi:hypothetical protein